MQSKTKFRVVRDKAGNQGKKFECVFSLVGMPPPPLDEM